MASTKTWYVLEESINMFLFFTILALIIAVLAVIFSLQNAVITAVSFFTFSFEGSLALILIVTFAVGVVAGLLLMAPYLLKARLKRRRLAAHIKKIKSKEGSVREEDIETEESQEENDEEDF